MTNDKKPSEKLSPLQGQVIKDSLGRNLILRNPDLLDMFDLTSAMGKESENTMLMSMAMQTLYVAKIDEAFIVQAKSYNQVRANLSLIGIEGFNAVNQYLEKTNRPTTEQEAVDTIKK